MSKYTQGPWQHFFGTHSVWSAKRQICVMAGPHKNKKEDEERYFNARLCASAPDLLEALIGVLRVADRQTDEFDAARAAIDKATQGQL